MKHDIQASLGSSDPRGIGGRPDLFPDKDGQTRLAFSSTPRGPLTHAHDSPQKKNRFRYASMLSSVDCQGGMMTTVMRMKKAA